MTIKTRKHMWPATLVVSLAIVGALAAFLVLATNPGSSSAHGGTPHDCSNMSDAAQGVHDAFAPEGDELCADSMPDPNMVPTVTGSLPNQRMLIHMVSDPIDVSTVFADADGDALTFSVMSNNTAVADAGVAGSQMIITAGTVRGVATITITADDGNGGTASTTLTVTVVERYNLTAEDADPAAPETYVVEALGSYVAKFNLGVTGSQDDVTVTVTVRPEEGITVTDSNGLIGAGFVDETEGDLEGSLTVKATDAGSRAFEIEGVCEVVGAEADILIADKDLELVSKGTILCKEPVVLIPDDQTTPGECYSVTGDVDLMRDDMDLHATDAGRTVKSAAGDRGIFRNTDGTLDIRNRRAEVGQDTTQVLVSDGSMQLTVTSCEPGPVYIRFMDENMDVFGTDVDECATCPSAAGADVVGLDSQGKLELNIMDKALNAGQALMYDQYTLVETALSPTSFEQYLYGKAGTYYQGKFRFIDPCSLVGDHFFVEVYEKYEKDLQQLENGMTYEKVICVDPEQTEAKDLTVTFTTADKLATTRGAVMTWEPIEDADTYTAVVIDPTDPTNYTIHGGMNGIVTTEAANARRAEFEDLVIGTRYIFALYATLADGTYSDLKFDRLTP